MPDLSEREKGLLKLVLKITFFDCPKCQEEHGIKTNHINHKLDISSTYNNIALSLAYLDDSLIGPDRVLDFLDHESLQPVINELVAEGFLTPMDKPCGGCGGLVYVRTDTMKQPASVLWSEDGRMCRFA